MTVLPLPRIAAALLLASGLSSAAAAAPIVYTSRVDFLAALSAMPVTQDFESIDFLNWGTEVSTPSGAGNIFTLGGVTVNATAGVTAYYDFGLSNTYLSTPFAAIDDPGLREIAISFASGVHAIGFDLLEYQSPDTTELDPITVTAFGVATILNDTLAPTFFGIVDLAATATQATISRSTRVDYPTSFDNVTYLDAVATPEPASSLLLLAASATLAWRRRARD